MRGHGEAKRHKRGPGRAGPRQARRGGGLRRPVVIVLAVALVAALLASGLLLRSLAPGGAPAEPSTPQAAIVDQLGLRAPNPEFVKDTTDMLEQAGYSVDYYPAEEVTVDLYRDLPSRGYEFIILRVHSGRVRGTGGSEIALFTSELYTPTKYVEEQRSLRLAIATSYKGGPQYFAIERGFIESSMRGRFDDTTVILMGCNGLRNDRSATAFLQKGAKSFVSWDRFVSASHTDAATERLLEHHLVNGLSMEDAVAQTMAEVGPGPSFGAELRIVSGGR